MGSDTIFMLNKMLADIDIYPTDLPKGKETINFFDEGVNYAYDKEEAKKNREKYLKGLSETDYPGTCLPGGTRCKPF